MSESTGQQSRSSITAGEYLEKALAWSKEVRREVRCDLDVPYGTDDRQKLDVYLPENAGSAGMPVLMFLHGGYWVLGHKDTLGFMAPPITLAPAILVTAGYRLAPGAKYPKQLDDCRNALKWVYENISGYCGDPDRIFVGGHSAGGHLASLISLQVAIEGLTPAEARWQPTMHTNHIAWLVWHMARVEDSWVSRLRQGSAQVWTAEGWADRFHMDPESTGSGHASEDIQAMPEIPLGDLMAYFYAVREVTRRCLDQTTESDLAQVYQYQDRNRSGTWIWGHILVEESQHTGQVAMIRGMTRGLSE